jgi:hypothetical protein
VVLVIVMIITTYSSTKACVRQDYLDHELLSFEEPVKSVPDGHLGKGVGRRGEGNGRLEAVILRGLP